MWSNARNCRFIQHARSILQPPPEAAHLLPFPHSALIRYEPGSWLGPEAATVSPAPSFAVMRKDVAHPGFSASSSIASMSAMLGGWNDGLQKSHQFGGLKRRSCCSCVAEVRIQIGMPACFPLRPFQPLHPREGIVVRPLDFDPSLPPLPDVAIQISEYPSGMRWRAYVLPASHRAYETPNHYSSICTSSLGLGLFIVCPILVFFSLEARSGTDFRSRAAPGAEAFIACSSSASAPGKL